jgi:multidrug efflux pump subunit AcrA (membrane-fusion protein)
MNSAKTKLAPAALAACLSLAACGGSPLGQGAAPPAPTASASGSTQAVKVSANTAGKSEIVAALKAAGVSNPERWAQEVIEYRPYAADDKNLTSLRRNLAKYNPSQETLDKIISVLTP